MTTVQIKGPFDMEHTPKLRRSLLHSLKPRENLEVDLSGLTFIDGAGLASLVEVFQTAQRQGTACTFSGASDTVHDLIRLNRLEAFFPFQPQT